MQPFTLVVGAAAPLMRANIDTDVIIRIERLTSLPSRQLGDYALEALRFRPDGSEDEDFVLNRPRFRKAPVLLAGSNFGCGSSREAAVVALMGMGVRCVIAPSFGDIFYSNCFQNGLLPVELPLVTVEALAMQCKNGAPVRIDLVAATVTAPDGTMISFEIDPLRRQALLEGLDDIGLTLKDDFVIRQWQVEDRTRRPWAWTVSPEAGN